MGRPTMVQGFSEAIGFDLGFGFSDHLRYNVSDPLFLCIIAQTVDEEAIIQSPLASESDYRHTAGVLL
jgi:hypothetical protein